MSEKAKKYKELTKSLQPGEASIQEIPRGPVAKFIGDDVSKAVRTVRDKMSGKIPLIDMTAGELLLGQTPEALEDWSYGYGPVRFGRTDVQGPAGALYGMKVDDRILDVAGAVEIPYLLGKAGVRGAVKAADKMMKQASKTGTEELEAMARKYGGPVKMAGGGRAGAFFSAIDKAIDVLKQKKGTGEQILKEIEKAPGVKKEELELRKIPEKLKSKKSITQEEVKALAAETPAPNIRPIIRSKDAGRVPEDWQPDLTPENKADLDALGITPVVEPENGNMLGFVIDETGDIVDYDTMFNMTHEDFGTTKKIYNDMMSAAARVKNQFNNTLSQAQGASAPKFEKYTTPGGENYREILLQLDQPGDLAPNKNAQALVNTELFRRGYEPLSGDQAAVLSRGGPDALAMLEDLQARLGINIDVDKVLKSTRPAYHTGHFDDPNILVHARVTDRTGPNGEKILFVEEVQSDWHQAGRNKGYQEEGLKEKLSALTDERAKVFNEYKNIPANEEADVFELAKLKTRLGEIDSEYAELQKIYERGVPDAPFKKTSHELALKQILDMAANEGYDRVAIAPGAEQIKRYNMGNELDTIRALRDDQGRITLSGVRQGRVVVDKLGIDPQDLPDYVGKEKADQILVGMGDDNIFELKGKDLEMTTKEGVGKKKIYDEILPNYLSKYAKKEFDADAGEIEINLGNKGKSYEEYLDEINADPYRHFEEDEIFDELHERVMDKANVKGYDFKGENADELWDQMMTREGPFEEIWYQAEQEMYQNKAKELADKGPRESIKAFSVPVTQQMREKITGEGQKLFAATPLVGVQAVPEAQPPEAAPQAEPEEEPQAFQRGGRVEDDEKSAARLIEEEPFVQSVLNAAKHYQGGKEIESGQAGIRKGPVTVGVNAANIRDLGARDAMQAQALFAAYRDRLGNVDVNASVNKPAQAPQGFYQGNVMASMPVGEGRVMGGVSGYKTPEKSDISGYNFGYEQKVGPGYASGMVFKPKDGRQDTRYDIQYNIPFQSGGRVGLAKKAIEAAMKKAGQKSGQVAEKDLTNIQDFQTSLNDRIAEKVREKKKLMDSFDFTYKPGDRVFTEWSAGNNYPPFEILDKATTQKRYARDPNTSKILRDAEGNKVEIQPEAGYLVRHKFNFNGEDVDHQYVIPEKNIKGVVEPDEPYKRGGPVGFQSGGRVGMARAAAEKLMRVLHGSPSSITPEPGKAIDVTTESGYAVKRGADKMLGKSGPPMVNKFDIPESRLLKFEEQYSPEDVALMKRFFNKLPEGQTMRGDEIWDAAQGRDVIMEGIAKAGGFAGYERPNTGAVGKGQWFRITEPDELKRGKKAGGLAQASKKL